MSTKQKIIFGLCLLCGFVWIHIDIDAVIEAWLDWVEKGR